MSFLKNIGKAVGDAVSFVGEKNRKAAYLNRIRTVIRCEEKAAEREYLALGRYYYNNLRDKDNAVTEAHCAELEAIEGRLEKALSQLELFYQCDKLEKKGEAGCIGIIGGQDGPTAVCVCGKKVSAEEVTLEDVKSFDHDPMEDAPAAAAKAAPAAPESPEPGENSSLPFEG